MMNNTNINRAMELINKMMPLMKELAVIINSDIPTDVEISLETKNKLHSIGWESFEYDSTLEEIQEVLETAEMNPNYEEDKAIREWLDRRDEEEEREYQEWLQEVYHDDEREAEFEGYDQPDEEVIYKISFDEKQFEIINDIANDISFGYLYNSISNNYVISIDDYDIYELQDRVDRVRLTEKFMNKNEEAANELQVILDILYSKTR